MGVAALASGLQTLPVTMMQSNTGLEERDTWRNKILRALDELRDYERTIGAMRQTAPKGSEADTGCTRG